MTEGEKTADYYLDYTITALKTVKVEKYPNGPVIKTVEKDSIVGEIFSWVKAGKTDGSFWWMLKEGGCVKYEAGAFKYSAQSKTQATIDRENKINDPLGSSEFFSFLDKIPVVATRLLKMVGILILIFLGWQMLWPLFRSFFRSRH